jgi:hypothetical protein
MVIENIHYFNYTECESFSIIWLKFRQINEVVNTREVIATTYNIIPQYFAQKVTNPESSKGR